MNKKRIFFTEFLKVLAIVLIGLVVIFPAIDAFRSGFKYSVFETFENLYGQSSLISAFGLLFITILVSLRRYWHQLNVLKTKVKQEDTPEG